MTVVNASIPRAWKHSDKDDISFIVVVDGKERRVWVKRDGRCAPALFKVLEKALEK